MKKLFSLILTVCLISCIAGLFACSEKPADTGNKDGLQDYVAGDKKIVKTLDYDISETTEAFYIGSSAISKVEVNGTEVPATDYIVRNKYLLMPDGWFEDLGVGNHTCKVTYKTKSLDFKFNISDEKPLVYTMPNVDKTYIPIDSVALGTVDFKVPTQEKTVSYTIKDSDGQTVDFSIENGVINIANPEVGEYTYTVNATRKNQPAIDETFKFNIVTREFYEGIIDTTNGSIDASMWYTFNGDNRIGHTEYTDIKGVTRSALFFERNAPLDEITRCMGINRERIAELLRLGYTKLSFYYCVAQSDSGFVPEIMIHRAGSSSATSWLTTKYEWTKAEIDMASMVSVENMLNDPNSNAMFGFLTRCYNTSTQRNVKSTIYLSEVVALGRSGEVDNYLGTYTCGNDTLVLTEDKATLGGEDYSYTANNNYVVIDNGNHEYTSLVYCDGLLYDRVNAKVYFAEDYKFEVTSDVAVTFAKSLQALTSDGNKFKVYVTENGIEDGAEDKTFTFSSSKSYSVKLEIGNAVATLPVNVIIPTSLGNLVDEYATEGAYSVPSGVLFSAHVAGSGCQGCWSYITSGKQINTMMVGSCDLGIGIDMEYAHNAISKGYTELKVTWKSTAGSRQASYPIVRTGTAIDALTGTIGDGAEYLGSTSLNAKTFDVSNLASTDTIFLTNHIAPSDVTYYEISFNKPYEYDYTSNLIEREDVAAIIKCQHTAGADCKGCSVAQLSNSVGLLRTNWCSYLPYFDQAFTAEAVSKGYTTMKIVWIPDRSNNRLDSELKVSAYSDLSGTTATQLPFIGNAYTTDDNGNRVTLVDISSLTADSYLCFTRLNAPAMVMIYEISFSK